MQLEIDNDDVGIVLHKGLVAGQDAVCVEDGGQAIIFE
jgi:hypothetical protein